MPQRFGSWLLCLTILAGCGGASSNPPESTGPSPLPSAAASDEPGTTSPSPEPSPTVLPSADPSPGGLADRRWAVVATDALNLRDGPSLDARVVGSATHGQLVFVTGSAIVADDVTWYPVVAMVGSGRSGWMAGDQGAETFLEQATGVVEQPWCGRLTAGATEFDQGAFEVRVTGVRLGGLVLAPRLFEPAMSTALSVAWGADAALCMRLGITDAELVSVSVDAFEARACGHGAFGAQREMILEARPAGSLSTRTVWLHEGLLGFDPTEHHNDLPNLGEALYLTSGTEPGCIKVRAGGGVGSTSITSEIEVVGCGFVTSRSDSEIVVADRAFDIVAGSTIGAEFVPEAGQIGMRVTVAGGPVGVLTIEAAEVPGCGDPLVP